MYPESFPCWFARPTPTSLAPSSYPYGGSHVQPVLASLTSAASSAGNSWTAFLKRFFNDGAKILDDAAGYLFLYLLVRLFVLGGLYLIVRTGFV